MLECQERTADKRLSEFVAEVAGTVRSLDENVGRGLIEPYSRIHHQLPATARVETRIRGHIDSRARKRQRCLSAAETVADLASAAGSGTVERFDSGREVVSLCLEREDGLDRAAGEIISLVGIFGIELVYYRAFHESHIILIGRYEAAGILFRGLFYHSEERRRHLLAVDNESAVENLMATVLRVDLTETEDFAVGQRTAEALRESGEIVLFIGAESEAFATVILADVGDMFDRLGFAVDVENFLVQSVVYTLKHLVVTGFGIAAKLIFLYAGYALKAHVLGYLDSIGAPRRYHFTTRPDKGAFYTFCAQWASSVEQPRQLFFLSVGQNVINFDSGDPAGTFFEKQYHDNDFGLVSDRKITNFSSQTPIAVPTYVEKTRGDAAAVATSPLMLMT